MNRPASTTLSVYSTVLCCVGTACSPSVGLFMSFDPIPSLTLLLLPLPPPPPPPVIALKIIALKLSLYQPRSVGFPHQSGRMLYIIARQALTGSTYRTALFCTLVPHRPKQSRTEQSKTEQKRKTRQHVQPTASPLTEWVL